MTADELAGWLRAHGHEHVTVEDVHVVTSTNARGAPRRYELANDTVRGMIGTDYWQQLQPKRRTS